MTTTTKKITHLHHSTGLTLTKPPKGATSIAITGRAWAVTSATLTPLSLSYSRSCPLAKPPMMKVFQKARQRQGTPLHKIYMYVAPYYSESCL